MRGLKTEKGGRYGTKMRKKPMSQEVKSSHGTRRRYMGCENLIEVHLE